VYDKLSPAFEGLEVTKRQGKLQLAERVSGAGNLDVLRRLTCQNQEQALRGATLKHLAGVMEISGAKAKQNRYP
jgi:hypothetical protein